MPVRAGAPRRTGRRLCRLALCAAVAVGGVVALTHVGSATAFAGLRAEPERSSRVALHAASTPQKPWNPLVFKMPKRKKERVLGPDDDGYSLEMRKRLRAVKLKEEKGAGEERAVSETKIDDLIAKEAEDATIAGLNTMFYMDREEDRRKNEEENPDTQILRKKYDLAAKRLAGVEEQVQETRIVGRDERGYLEMTNVQDIEDVFAQARAAPARKPTKTLAGSQVVDIEEEEEQEEGIADYLEAFQRQSAMQDKVSKRVVKSPEQRKQDYEDTKDNLYLATSFFGVLGAAVAFAMYGLDAAFSFGIGSFGALYYLSGLAGYADAAETPMGQMMGGRRLVVPVILVLIVTNWEKICLRVPQLAELGLTPQLLPVLLGFFTYVLGKVASGFLPTSREDSD